MKKTTQRSILMMENGCKSPYTRNVYRHRLNQWVEHLGMDSDSTLFVVLLGKLTQSVTN